MALVLLTAFYYFIRVINYAVLAFCILSFIARPGGKLFLIYQKLGYLLDPLFAPFRTLLYKLGLRIGVDFSPWLAMIALDLIYNLLVRLYLSLHMVL